MILLLSLLLTVLLAAHGGLAIPVAGKKGIDSGLLATFNLMEQYAAAAYCKSNNNSPGDEISCSAGNCPLAEAAQTNTVLEFAFDKNNPNTQATGYVAADNTNKLIIVSFRGSNSAEDWATNLNFDAVPVSLCSGCTAHGGFWGSWLKSRNSIFTAVNTTLRAHPDYKVVTTGHSLGGALASLAAADLRNNGFNVALYSFGAPRIAGLKLSKYISEQPGGNYRVTHWNDIVPHLPPVFLDFAHISPEYYIKKPNNQPVAASDIYTYTGYQNWFGNGNLDGNGGWLVTDIGAHLWYFNKIAACGA